MLVRWIRTALTTARVASLISLIGLSDATVSAQDLGRADEAISESNVVSLFDGQSLEGWDFDPAHWRVENGAIVGLIPNGQTLDHNTWCVWKEGELRDFELNLQFRLTGEPGCNSGIQIRCQVDSVDHVSGYQADLDMGGVWLGRIYDEHGRALIVERGRRVHLQHDGQRLEQLLAPANQYAVLFRENDWNDYRIVAVGHRIKVWINGTLFSDLFDEQSGEFDPVGQLALQLHSGPGTKIEFRNLTFETLSEEDDRVGDFAIEVQEVEQQPVGLPITGLDGEELDLGFESGDLSAWEVTGDAFSGQPVAADGIATRWAGQVSNKQGRYFIGGYELVGDAGVGTMRSQPFIAHHPYASFLLSGGDTPDTRVEVVLVDQDDRVLMQAVGEQREQMERFVVDLRQVQGEKIAVRVIDESRGGWGHLNFDDFRFHESTPAFAEGIVPTNAEGQTLNLGFESGDLAHWTADGDAFAQQPRNEDGITERWPDQKSGKEGEFFIGGFEVVQDSGKGTLTSEPFVVTHPFASFLVAGGKAPLTRVDIVRRSSETNEEDVVYSIGGDEREEMRRVVVDLTDCLGDTVFVRLVDESDGYWGHLNFDDFRFHDSPPATSPTGNNQWRTTENPLLNHLIPNEVPSELLEQHPAWQTAASMYVPEGFSVDVVAAEPELYQPMAFTFDARGRLWVVEGNCYPLKRPEGEGLDRVLIFSDEDSDGTFETKKVFVEGLNLVSGMQVGHSGVWIGAAPELLFIPDVNGDDVPDGPAEVLLDGFGFADTHETINSMIWGPDGWLYGNQGVFNQSHVGAPGCADEDRVFLAAGVWRYHPVRKVFEVFAHGGSNPWGLDYDEYGQFFMTHCRSYWGRGLTTQVVQGGHYWNQVNSGYAPFVCNHPVAGREHLRNFLLASARYGHGEGGAGKAGSGQVYGGHSHVGTLIYQGNNWPQEYHNHLLTSNLHGHQLNHQINLREGSGYNTVHAGYDVMFCSDPQYVGVSLQCGPDGAVYLSDWYDVRHCHSPNAEQWDRSNGRIYRIKYDSTYAPVTVDLQSASDVELIELLNYENEWHSRMARLVLADRAARGVLEETTLTLLAERFEDSDDPHHQVRLLWALVSCGVSDLNVLAGSLKRDEYVRAWQIRLSADAVEAGAAGKEEFARVMMALAQSESSLFVRKHLISASRVLDSIAAWPVLRILASQSENGADRDLPSLLWFAVAERMQNSDEDLLRGISLGEGTAIRTISDFTMWYAPQVSAAGRERVLEMIASSEGEDQKRRLLLMADGLSGTRGLEMPASFLVFGPALYVSDDGAMRAAALNLGIVFGDELLFDQMRDVLASDAPLGRKSEALSILTADSRPLETSTLIQLLDTDALREASLPMLRRSNDVQVALALIERLGSWDNATRDKGLEILCSRAAWGMELVNAIEREAIDKSWLTAYYARQLAGLNDAALTEKLGSVWGRLQSSSEEKLAEIDRLSAAYTEAPLWAYDAGAGQQHFQKLCANCHLATPEQPRIGPPLEGSGAKGVRYILENVIDPNAVVGRDFQATIVVTLEGRSVTGVVIDENETALTLRTSNAVEVIPLEEIDQRAISPNSFMPEGILDPLSDRERIELLKYLMGL